MITVLLIYLSGCIVAYGYALGSYYRERSYDPSDKIPCLLFAILSWFMVACIFLANCTCNRKGGFKLK